MSVQEKVVLKNKEEIIEYAGQGIDDAHYSIYKLQREKTRSWRTATVVGLNLVKVYKTKTEMSRERRMGDNCGKIQLEIW